MDLELVKRCWREDTESSLPPLKRGDSDANAYEPGGGPSAAGERPPAARSGGLAPLIAVLAASLVSGFTLNRVLAACTVVLMIGAVMATLWWAQHRIDEAPLDRSLHEALVDLRSKVDAASRAYVSVYVGFFVLSAAILLGVVWWRNGMGPLFAGFLVMSVLAGVVLPKWTRLRRAHVSPAPFRPGRVPSPARGTTVGDCSSYSFRRRAESATSARTTASSTVYGRRRRTTARSIVPDNVLPGPLSSGTRTRPVVTSIA